MSRSQAKAPVPQRRREDSAIAVEEAVRALRRSGYLLEDRLDAVLRRKSYSTTPNSALPDGTTNKSRELDLVAESWKFDRNKEAERRCGVFHQLVIECINNPQPVAFITKQRQVEPADLGLKMTPDRVAIGPQGQDQETGQMTGKEANTIELLDLAKYHHYVEGRVATQYCTFKKKGESRQNERRVADLWMATHENDHNDDFVKLCDAVRYYFPEHQRRASPRRGLPSRHHGLPAVSFLYPVLVVQGDLLEVQQVGEDLSVKPTNHIRYRHVLTRGEHLFEYRIDVVTEAFFPAFLRLIEQSRSEVLRRYSKVVRENPGTP